ncbi:cytosolic arginine sensor for mTORC1 subunit 2 isoform X4 [Gallus gallus]|uniref:cytosolic arginine sensor for mTORC1 subunit 2 isoform X4 n=1 Tax=Gallus gallus TaxID=9031 RepID=UPI000739F0C5|nr:cytosolic arginine sensor for mTORC1 subunit 2 isoform X4 [Gallus gallus]XP_046785928.1 cytosolic arginine sensor for mTORC1 subunit 2 isoform X4 [Gallus gallus]|eukprot:XP_015151188.1 cytosolic arginine sensor for mTORC1 subunit 2 isoform X2 [Gallus gallus]
MELHILEHRLRVASIAKESIQLFTYGLIKLAFLSSKTRGRKTPSLCPLPRVHLSAWAFPSQTTGIANASSGAFPRLGDFVALFRTRNGDVNSAARTLLVFPAWCKFFSLTETPEDYTIIVDEEGFLELPSSEHLSVADATWLALNVVSGGGGFSGSQPIGVTKIAKSVIAPLADQNISVFMLSTYQTDFILVRERDLPFVMHTLAAEFTILRVVNGETVAADDLGITNGFVKPKLVQRPVIHPLSSPSNMFCVTSLDPDTLPTVATLLMDVMFYSNGVKDSVVGNEDSGHIRFFSFSLIEGYISLVMDVQTQQRFPNNLLFTSASGELWKMVRIGGQPLGFDECGIVAQISEPLAAADIPAYYISTFKFDHALVPEENINGVVNALQVSQAEKH